MRFIFALGLAGPEDSTVPNESHAIAGMFAAIFEYELGDVLCGARERQIDVRLRASSAPNRRRPHRHALRSYRAALRRALRRVLQPTLHYELEQISKSEILPKLKQRFGGKTIRDVRFRVG